MSLNKDNQLKCEDGSITEPITILKAGSEELPFGTKYVVHIKETIEGYDHFLPSEGLIKKIKESNADIGDKITIEKIAPDQTYPYGYFKVEVIAKEQETKEIIEHKSIKNMEKPFKEVASNMETHELSVRVENLSSMVDDLTKLLTALQKGFKVLVDDYKLRTAEQGHKQGDESLPF